MVNMWVHYKGVFKRFIWTPLVITNELEESFGFISNELVCKKIREITQVIALNPISGGVIALRSRAIALDCRSN